MKLKIYIARANHTENYSNIECQIMHECSTTTTIIGSVI
jgi:hypothetical protein